MTDIATGAVPASASFAEDLAAGLDGHLRQFLATAASYVFSASSKAPALKAVRPIDPAQPEK